MPNWSTWGTAPEAGEACPHTIGSYHPSQSPAIVAVKVNILTPHENPLPRPRDLVCAYPFRRAARARASFESDCRSAPFIPGQRRLVILTHFIYRIEITSVSTPGTVHSLTNPRCVHCSTEM